MIKQKSIWIYATVFSFVLLIFAEIYSDQIIGNSYTAANEEQKVRAGYFALFTLAVFIMNLVGAFKTKRFGRAFAIFSSFISLIFFGFAVFAWSLSGGGAFTF